MKVHPMIAAAALGAILSLQGWMLSKISTLSENVAGLTAKVEAIASTQRLAKQ
jgi:outer membrane murein-binding lipoprotein Lpp